MKQTISLLITTVVIGGCVSSTTVTFPEEHPAHSIHSRKFKDFPLSPVLSAKHTEPQDYSYDDSNHHSHHKHHTIAGGER